PCLSEIDEFLKDDHRNTLWGYYSGVSNELEQRRKSKQLTPAQREEAWSFHALLVQRKIADADMRRAEANRLAHEQPENDNAVQNAARLKRATQLRVQQKRRKREQHA
ncbi:hypothetical protein PI124_g21568, partial [Phytophthora idaei]